MTPRRSPAIGAVGPLSRVAEDRCVDRTVQRSLPEAGVRALQSGQPGEPVPELTLYDIDGNHQELSRCCDKQPALLVTMSLSCGPSRRHARALRRLARRFERYINMVIIYILEAHPIDAPSPYANRIWTTGKNETAGVLCPQPRTLNARIELADQLRRRCRRSNSMLIDALDDRA